MALTACTSAHAVYMFFRMQICIRVKETVTLSKPVYNEEKGIICITGSGVTQHSLDVLADQSVTVGE